MKPRQYLPLAASLGAGAVVATATAADLAPYALPGHLLATCVMATGASSMWLARHITDLLTGASDRCPECDFSIKVSGVDAAESRRWQEAVADHPRHHLPH
ncbi:hypothetical protein [Streptomyces benahoarensis]|uniref:Uncharacterized protein n=1 Tax=Streptomyces benahoarensis TaxID=2595054 RepID=A0A553YPP9_9ACTN|nr:hypothetical protein [Streptomyces benahoarensis]TSB07296.1 hypothetical protein FNJ62_31150 [Streptomyces benahoarensis]TSB31159.1 hypothetical protein FNZ23_26035 [Streptomyces benahoarensis]